MVHSMGVEYKENVICTTCRKDFLFYQNTMGLKKHFYAEHVQGFCRNTSYPFGISFLKQWKQKI